MIGLSSLIAALIARLTGIQVDARTVARVIAAAQAAGATATTTASLAAADTKALTEQTTETEAKLINDGRFAEYHLAKAKRAFAAQDFRTALTQAAASLAHGDLTEAAQLRAAAKAAMK